MDNNNYSWVREPYISTRTGRRFPFLNPTAEDIDPLDIATGLAHTARFGGQTRVFYSVAQHCLALAEMVDHPVAKLYALLHDAAEAYIGDMPTPIKATMPQFREAEEAIMWAVWEWAGFTLSDKGALYVPWEPWEEEIADQIDRVDYLDKHAPRAEAEHLLSPVPEWAYELDPLPDYPGKMFMYKPHSYWESKYLTTLNHVEAEASRYLDGAAKVASF